MHSLVTSDVLIAFLFHSLQSQITSRYTDTKLVEMILYLLQLFARIDQADGKLPLSLTPISMSWITPSLDLQIDVDSFRDWLTTREVSDLSRNQLEPDQHSSTFVPSGWVRDRLWQPVIAQQSPSTCSGNTVVDLLVTLIRDENCSSDLQLLAQTTLQMLIREDHEVDDRLVVERAQAQDQSRSETASTVSHKAIDDVMAKMKNDLSSFIDMYGDFDDEDEEGNGNDENNHDNDENNETEHDSNMMEIEQEETNSEETKEKAHNQHGHSTSISKADPDHPSTMMEIESAFEEYSLVPEFNCALCHSGPSKEKNMFPCLLCHVDDNNALCTIC